MPIVSSGQDGDGVQVIGEGCPTCPDPLALDTLQPRSPQPVASLEVGDATLGPDSVAGQAAFGAPRAPRLLAAGDEGPFGRDRGELLVGAEVAEAAVEGELARADPEAGELGDGLRQELVLVRGAGKRGGRQQKAALAGLGRGGELAELDDVAELGRLALLALANRPRIGV